MHKRHFQEAPGLRGNYMSESKGKPDGTLQGWGVGRRGSTAAAREKKMLDGA